MRLIIGLSGKIGSGKTTAADVLVRRYDFHKISFAAPIKEAACIIFGLKPEDFITGKNVVDPYWGITRRKMLQILGTECIRDNFAQDFWVRRAEKEIAKLRPHVPVVIDDVRFPEEVVWLNKLGARILKLTSERVLCTEEEQGHPSEGYEVEAYSTYQNDSSERALIEHVSDFYLAFAENHGHGHVL